MGRVANNLADSLAKKGVDGSTPWEVVLYLFVFLFGYISVRPGLYAFTLNIFITTPSPLCADNKSDVRLITNLEFHKRTEHLEVDYHFVREK